MNTRSFILSVLIAGALIGLLGSLPLLNLINCILCLWVWLCGMLAAFLYRRYQRGGLGLSIVQVAGLGARWVLPETKTEKWPGAMSKRRLATV